MNKRTSKTSGADILKIIPSQIAGAQGFNAVYLNSQPDVNGNWFSVFPLACWGLVQEGDWAEIHGFIADDYVTDCEDTESFFQYVHDREITDSA